MNETWDDFAAATWGELTDEWERADLAARWMLRGSPPSPAHYRDVMHALADDAPTLVVEFAR